MRKRSLSVIIALAMALCMPLTAYAETPTTSTEDITPPTLNDISLSATEVTAPGTVEVIVDASDDLSGVDDVSGVLFNKTIGKTIGFYAVGTYTDPETYERKAYADGKLHGTITVDQYTGSGDYIISSVGVYDKARNSKYYTGSGSDSYESDKRRHPEDVLSDSLCNLTVRVNNTVDKEDITPPVLNDIRFSTNEVGAPGTVEVIVDASDDLSGVDDVSGVLFNKTLGKTIGFYAVGTYTDPETYERKAYADGKLHGTITVDQYTGSGDYIISSVGVYDKARNSKYYTGSGSDSYESDKRRHPEDVLPDSLCNLTVRVNNTVDKEDITPPVLNDIRFSINEVETPGTVDVIVDASDDLSGVDDVSGVLFNKTIGKTIGFYAERTYFDYETYERKTYADGKLHGTITVDQYTGSGDYIISSVGVYDKARNSKYYTGSGSDSYESDKRRHPEDVLPDSLCNLMISVFNTGRTPNVTTSTTDTSLATKITNVADDGIVVADFSNNADVSSDVFTAMAGSNKEVTFTSEGVSWQFNGSDIDPAAAKAINLAVSVTTVAQDNSPESREIASQAGNDTSALVLRFADNGQLPGKAKIRIKADYSLRNYLGTTGLQVFYWDSTNKVLVPVASNVSLTGDNNIEFEITHCSYYVVTGKTVNYGGGSSSSEGNSSGSSGSSSGGSSSEDRPSQTYVDMLNIKLNAAATAGGAQTVEWKTGNALPISIMTFLKEHPQITLVFSYRYENNDYTVVIPGKDAIVDNSIPWYGPLWLAGHYSTSTPVQSGTVTAGSSGTYRVQSRDSLWTISRKLGTSVKKLKSLNPSIKDENKIYVGQELKY